MSRRTEMISSQLRGELARLLREEVMDPRVGLVTLTRVDVSPDLSNALVLYSVMGDDTVEGIEPVAAGLHSAASFLRRRAARTLGLRRMPELRFRYDPSLVLGAETLSLLRETAADSARGVADSTAAGKATADPAARDEDDGAQT